MKITTRAVEVSALALAISVLGGSVMANSGYSAPKESTTGAFVSIFSANNQDALMLRLRPENQAATLLGAMGVKIVEPPALQEPEPAASTEQFYEGRLIEVLRAVGFKGDALRHAWAVAMKESTGNPEAHNQNTRTGDNSYGLFQINMIGKLGPARVEKYGLSSYEDLFDPYINARVAYQMSGGGADWGPWGIGPNAYNGGTTGSYHKWLQEYPGGNNNG
jgi:hypothetical protein